MIFFDHYEKIKNLGKNNESLFNNEANRTRYKSLNRNTATIKYMEKEADRQHNSQFSK